MLPPLASTPPTMSCTQYGAKRLWLRMLPSSVAAPRTGIGASRL
jgi:hypothetical protein